MRPIALGVAVLAMAGCSGGLGGMFEGGSAGSSPFARGDGGGGGAVITEPEVGEAEAADIAPSDDALRADAVAEGDTAQGDAVRGFTVASLGDAAEPGLWIETPLVDRERIATVVAPNGTTVEVAARPSGGAQGSGSRLSLAAFQALGLDLTSLPTVTVIAE
ncbi:hypothetical protein [Gymnodinialimonas ulvae]|uniref:hypothetical protein n=1 Tax=Gymnodinialimonas ulvae TaxID=3126504 RepID=UPI0030AF16F3